MKTKYRADIDGLRAIAVLAVVLGHAGFELFSGGYIGVDVFFVISGYLITTILVREIEQNEFSILKFYERRIRRIFPALFVVLGVVSLLCLWLYNSNNLLEFGKSLLAATLFSSNFLFWSQAGYFDAPSLLKPLLHTWSLAVEEQFYIFFPWLLFAAYRYGKARAKIILAVLAAGSLALSIYGVYGLEDGGSTAFYLLHMRAWELLGGSLIALGIFSQKPGVVVRNVAAFTGLLLIGFPIFLYTNTTPFPGISALPPVLGTGLIIWAGEDNAESSTWVSKLLSMRPLVFIGLISYSLYLWHWPILVLAMYFFIPKLGAMELSISLVLIFVLSTLSWRFVEQPFRINPWFDRRRVFRFAGAAMLTSVLFGLMLYQSNGFSSIAYFHSLDESLPIPENCDLKRKESNEIRPADLCTVGKEGDVPSFLEWGDSHARASGYGVHLAAKKMGLTGNLAFTNGCPPIMQGDVKSKCNSINNQIVAYLASHPEIKLVILDARWTLYYKHHESELFPGLEGTLKKLTDIKKSVVIMLPTPEMQVDIPATYFIALRRGLDINQLAGETLPEYLGENKDFFLYANTLVKKYSVRLIQPWKVLCNQKMCPAVMNGKILYVDKNHISGYAAELIAPLFTPAFRVLKNSTK